tara:strand:- start:232 stop:720 length:489 start_codon:yes stop_codon:yes gene_type:complete
MMNSPFGIDQIEFELDPDLNVVSPLLLNGLEIWRQARGMAAMPARRDFDPVRLPLELLPHILLVDVEYLPEPRFRWRLIGTYITDMIGRDSTGRYWDEIYDANVLAAISKGPRWVLEHRRPIRSLGTAPVHGRAHRRSENLDMPLSSDGEKVDMLLVISVYS